MNYGDAYKLTRSMLERAIPAEEIPEINAENGISLSPGATLKDALDAVILRKAEEGDKAAEEAAKEFGLDGR